MATPLDIGLLKNFEVVFAFLLVFAVLYGVLEWRKFLGENKGIHAIIAIAISVLVLFSPFAVKLISNMAPWFVFLFIFIVFILLGFSLLGVTNEQVQATVLKQAGIKWALFIAGVIILLMAMGSTFGQQLLEKEAGSNTTTTATTASGSGQSTVAGGSYGSNVGAIFANPKILGMILILLVATAAVGLLGVKSE